MSVRRCSCEGPPHHTRVPALESTGPPATRPTGETRKRPPLSCEAAQRDCPAGVHEKAHAQESPRTVFRSADRLFLRAEAKQNAEFRRFRAQRETQWTTLQWVSSAARARPFG